MLTVDRMLPDWRDLAPAAASSRADSPLDSLCQSPSGRVLVGNNARAGLAFAPRGRLDSLSLDVDYGMTPDGVIDAFNDAYASGNVQEQHSEFALLNERGCTAKD